MLGHCDRCEETTSEQRLSAVTLNVASLDRAIAFYADGLGLMVAQRHGDEAAFLPMNGLILCLYNDLANDAGVTGEGRGPGLTAVAHNVRDKAGVDALLERAGGAGGRITKGAHDTAWGGRSGYFADPDGHLWEVAWNPFWPIDAEGRTTLGS